MHTPYFSVVIPTKGRSFIVGGAIESALRQTFTDLEVIVADNDDGDATRDVVARFQDPRLRYHRTGGLSMPDNWESGCAQARGEYLLILEDKQAFKFRSLERIHRATETERPDCLKWLCDMLDDTGPVTFVDEQKGTGAVRRLDPEEILKSFTQHGLNAVSRTLPIGHYGGFSRALRERIKNGPMQRLCPPVSPDYALGFLALAYAESVLYFDEALVASSRLHSNGRSFVLKTGNLRKQFVSELGGRDSIFFDLVPVKAVSVPGGIYNDYLRIQRTVGGRLEAFPLNWPNYFAETYEFMVGCQEYGVNMDSELAAWKDAWQAQPPAIQTVVAGALSREGPLWKKKLHTGIKKLRQQTGLLRLEHGFKARMRVLLKRKLSGRFASPFQYVEWEGTQPAKNNG